MRDRIAELEQTIRDLQAELERQRQPEAAQRASQRQDHALYEHTPAMCFTLTVDGTLLSVNRFWADELGYRVDELLGHSILAVVHDTDHDTVLKQLRRCAQSLERTFEWEIQKRRKNGTRFWVKERARTITGPDGNPIIHIVCEDITAHRRTHTPGHHQDGPSPPSPPFLHTLVQQSPFPMISLNAEARITNWNQAATTLFGWTEDEVVGQELPYIPVGQEGEAESLWNDSTRSKVRGPLALRRQRKDGTCLDLLMWPGFVENATGQLEAAVGLYIDPSNLHHATTAQRPDEEQAAAFLNALDDLAFHLDEQGTYLNVWTKNDALLLLPKPEFIGKSLTDIHGQEEGTRQRNILANVLASGQPHPLSYTLTIRGQVRHFSAVFSRIPSSAHAAATVACLARETTVQTDATETLRVSEQRMNSIIETAPECVKITDASGRLLHINAAGLTMIETDHRHDILGHSIYPLVAESHREAFRAMNERVCQGHKESLEFEIIGLRGTRRWVETCAVPLRNPADGVILQLAITRDITRRKHVELALRESEQRFEIAFRSSPHPVLITELATGRCIDVNDTALRLFGFERHHAVGRTTLDIALWPAPEDRTRFITQLAETGTLREMEVTLQTKDRRFRHCLISSELIELNGTQCILTVGTDITERKEAESALRESEERWQHFVTNAPVGLVIVDGDKRLLSANKAFCTLTGYSEQEVVNRPDTQPPHPDDAPHLLELTDEFFLGLQQDHPHETRYVRKNGDVIWVSIRASRLAMHEQPAPLWLAIIEDITDRKQALADRERISQDLHDNILQSLYAVGMQLEAGKLLVGKAPRKSKQHVTHAIQQLNHLVLEVRQFITDLTRRTVPTLDFTVALNQLIASCSSETRTAPSLHLAPPALADITPVIGEQLLSITREALSNSVRHANAPHRSVSLTKTDRSIQLRIADDGTGFDLSHKRRRGHGLSNMAARARTIGAQFSLDSAPGHGTSITIDVPTGNSHAR